MERLRYKVIAEIVEEDTVMKASNDGLGTCATISFPTCSTATGPTATVSELHTVIMWLFCTSRSW